jgi:hypothetical protein
MACDSPASETEESLRQAATARLREAVQAARTIGDRAIAKRIVAAATSVFFVELAGVTRRFPRDTEGK